MDGKKNSTNEGDKVDETQRAKDRVTAIEQELKSCDKKIAQLGAKREAVIKKRSDIAERQAEIELEAGPDDEKAERAAAAKLEPLKAQSLSLALDEQHFERSLAEAKKKKVGLEEALAGAKDDVLVEEARVDAREIIALDSEIDKHLDAIAALTERHEEIRRHMVLRANRVAIKVDAHFESKAQKEHIAPRIRYRLAELFTVGVFVKPGKNYAQTLEQIDRSAFSLLLEGKQPEGEPRRAEGESENRVAV